MGRTKGASDKTKRRRRSKTNAEKDETRRAKLSKQGIVPITNAFGITQQQDTAAEAHEDIDPAADTEQPLLPQEEVEGQNVIIFSEVIDDGRDEVAVKYVANLDVDDCEGDDLDDEIEAEADDDKVAKKPRPTKRGIQQDYMRAIHDRLKCESGEKTNGLEAKWMLTYLKENNWWVRKEHALQIVQKLKSKQHSPSTYKNVSILKHNKAYYRDILVWIPDMMWGGICKPPCPTCKSDKDVSSWGFNSDHVARLVIGLKENYYVMTRRYKCSGCEKRKLELEKGLQTGEKVKLPKYTFMGWDPKSLPLMAFGCGDEFPAFLTWKAALDMSLVDMMRAEFAKGIRPETFSNSILEYHAKHYTRSHLQYERGIMIEKHKAQSLGMVDNKEREMFSAFDDEEKWNDTVPTGQYFATAYKAFAMTLRSHFSNEVKKRGAKTLAVDVSYKSSSNMHKVKTGASVFKGLVTGTNDIGEVRIQHHVVSDSHDQMKAPLEAFIQTTEKYGLPQPQIVSTDNPSRDNNHLMETFKSLRDQKDEFNKGSTATHGTKTATYPYDDKFVKIVTSQSDICSAVSAMDMIMNKEKGMALDCEWRVQFYGHGKKNESKVGLIQLAYFNKEQNDRKQYLLIRTHKLDRLPGPLVSLLSSNSVNVVGVNVGGDLLRIGKDFGVQRTLAKRDAKTIISLGVFARKRDVVQSGSVGMKHLVKVVLGYDLEKRDEDKFSNWNANELTSSQVKYAVGDVCAPLTCYEKLCKIPDLTIRLRKNEATPGKKVDLVPRHGNVACMATRAATGYIIDNSAICQSPDGIVQKEVRAGNGMVAIQLEQIYSPGLKLPHYRKEGCTASPTLADFGTGRVVVPVQMLKEHVTSDLIRAYPTTDENAPAIAGMTQPSRTDNTVQASSSQVDADTSTQSTTTLPSVADSTVVDAVDEDGNDDIEEYPSEDQIYEMMPNLTSNDISILRASIVECEESATGRTPLQCKGLADPPKPGDIRDVFSPILGDLYHAMNRPYVSTNHEVKKSYYCGLQNAMYIPNSTKMAELERRMIASGMTKDQIESMKYYNSRFFNDCIDREVPPPSILYWRVRAVFALYGPMKDSKTNKPLFNDEAWKKANGVLKEILLGYYSDPPGMAMYTKKLNKKNGSVMKNKYGMDLIECMRGTNRTEAYHKNLAVTFYAWHTGIKMSDCLLAENRHRYNHLISERRRLGFPILGHFDTWLVDQLQLLVLSNHGRVLYPDWSNASDFVETPERFDTVAIHDTKLHEALNEQWENKVDQNNVKLTSDQKYLCEAMGTQLPFLPFTTVEENKQFAQCVLSNDFPTDEDEAAIAWCKFVDGVNIFPKLPVHIRIHREAFQRNQRVKNCVEKAKAGKDMLDKLNRALQTAKPAAVDRVAEPDTLPVVHPQAMHNLPYVIAGGTAIGNIPKPNRKRSRGERGQDISARAPKSCGLCLKLSPETRHSCRGRGGKKYFKYWNLDNSQKV